MTTPQHPDTPEGNRGVPQPRVWFLTGDELAATRAKIAQINTRAIRKGFTGRVELDATPAVRSHTPAPGAPPVTFHGFDVTITGEPPVYSGWRFVAAIDKLPTPEPGRSGPGAVVIRYAPGADDAVAHDEVRPGECDHCHTVRPRSTTLLVRHDSTGELKQVGRTCLRDFLGASLTPVFLDTDRIGDEIERATGSGPRQWDIESVLTYTWAVVATHGWTPASAATGRPSTRDLVTDALLGGRPAHDLLASIAGHLEKGQQIAPRILVDLPAQLTGTSGYEANLLAVLRAGSVGPKHLGLAVSAVNTWNRLAERRTADELRHQRRTPVHHAGTIGEPLTLSGTVVTATRVPGYHHCSPDQVLLVIDCDTAIGKTITSAAWAYQIERGDQLTVTGKVKAHTDYHGVPQTVLARPKRIDVPVADVEPAAEPVPVLGSDWEVVNPTQAGPRPFPGPPNPLAETPHPQAVAH